MKIQALNMTETQAHLLTHFPYYDTYLNWRFNDDDEKKSDFTLISYPDKLVTNKSLLVKLFESYYFSLSVIA